MAAPKETHPESSSDEEVESGSSSDEEVESGEEEEVEAGGQGQKEESDEEKEEESESDEEKEEEESESDEEKEEEDSESDEEKDEDSQKKTVPSKPASSSVIPVSSKPASSSSPATAAEGEDGLKKKNETENIDPKQPFARVWSEEEETVILEELFKRKERGDSLKDVPGFLDSIKGKLHFAATILQMENKIRRLKKKFQNNFKRGKGGLDPKFSKAHDLECYGFMKVIWKGQEVVSSRKRSAPAAADNGNANGGKKKRRKRVSEPSSYPFLTFAIQDRRNSPAGGEMLWKECLPLLGGPTVEEMERKWREFHRKEVQLNLERLDLLEGPTVEEMGRKWREFHRKEVQLNLERLDLAREMTAAFLNASPT